MAFRKRNVSGERPLPLKQRTSSSTDRRDFTHNTWTSLLVLIKFREFFVTVDNFSIWRRHLAWAYEDGKDLRSYMTQRYGSNMVFMSLMLSTELGVLFNSSEINSQVRNDLRDGHHGTISFWAGLFIIISALLILLSLISTFTAWAMVNSIDEANAHCILRSSIGQYAAELPGRLIVCSIYSFLISFSLFFFLLLPLGPWSILLLLITACLFLHVVSVFSCFGRVIMHSGAMGKTRIFSPEYEDFLVPHSLHSNLLSKAKVNLANNTSIIRQYRKKQRPIDRHLLEDELYDHLCGLKERNLPFFHARSSGGNNNSGNNNMLPSGGSHRARADSTVRFADEEMGILSGVDGGGGVVGGYDSTLSSGARYGSHLRTLTPLSDKSFSQGTNVSEITMDRPTPQSAGGATSVPRRPFARLERPLGGSHPPPKPPKPDVNADSSVRNVSNVSLEQWLQGSIHGSPKGDLNTATKEDDDKKDDMTPLCVASPEVGEASLLSSPTSFPGLPFTSHDDDNNTIGYGNKRMKSPPPREVVTDWLPSVGRSSLGSPDDEEGTHRRRRESESETSQGRPAPSSTFDDRELSEYERFAIDYGDFGDLLDGESSRMISGQNNYHSRYTHNENQIDSVDSGDSSISNYNSNDGNVDDDKKDLLDSHRKNSPEDFHPRTTAPPIAKLSSGPSPPPPQRFFHDETKK